MRALKDWVKNLRTATESRNVGTASTRVVIPGNSPLDFSDYTTMRTEESIHRIGQPPELLARFEWPSSPEFRNDMNTLGGEPQEWAGLLTFTYNRRIEALEELFLGTEGTSRALALPLCDRLDSALMAPIDDKKDSGQDVTEALKKLLSLNPDDYDIISAAMQMHYGAALLSVRETNASYALLVGAMELLSQKYGQVDRSWDSWSEATKWEARFKKLKLDQEQQRGMRSALIKENKHRNLKRGFVSYVADRIPLEFWSEPVADWVHELNYSTGNNSGGSWTDPRPRFIDTPTASVIEKALSGTYQVRSDFVHEGKRHISLAEESHIQIKPEHAKRLPIRAAREALRYLIDLELNARATHFDLPPIRRTSIWTPEGHSFY